MKTEDAEKKWCPHARYGNGINRLGDSLGLGYCITNRCMAWEPNRKCSREGMWSDDPDNGTCVLNSKECDH